MRPCKKVPTGVRRIEAVTSNGAFEYCDRKLRVLEKLETSFSAKDDVLLAKVAQLQESLQSQNKEIRELKDKLQSFSAQNLLENTKSLKNGTPYKHIEASAEDDIRKLGDLFIDKYPNGLVLITQKRGDKLGVLLKTFKKNKDINCSDLVKEIFNALGGKGGGKPDMAQGSVELNQGSEFVKQIQVKIDEL